MGKTLGIDDDYWHGILSFAIVIAITFAAFLFADIPFSHHKEVIAYMMQGKALIVYGIAIIIIISLQWINERIQFNDPYRDIKYGSLANFLKNSKRDWKWTLVGLFFGIILSFFILIMILG